MMRNDKIITLQELVTQPKCLKLLILHTPFTLQIDSLPLYTNLVKLDLSRNNLQQFPYMGDLFNLKFIIIHQNKLDLPDLKRIFQKDQQKSILSRNVIWVTFWGNKNTFLARHYLANQTSAIAVDTHMIVQEQRKQAIDYFSYQPFSEKTDISLIFKQNKKFDSAMPEQQYMKHFWDQINFIRRKQEQINPILKIQKVYRGWIYRKTKQRFQKKLKIIRQTKRCTFSAWKQYHIRNKKVRKLLQMRQKKHLLWPIKQLKHRQIQLRMIQLAVRAKMRVFTQKTFLKYQYKFYKAITGNWFIMKSLYQRLYLNQSKKIYINKHNWKQFEKIIIPFGQKFNPREQISISKTHRINLQYLFDYQCGKRQFIKLLNVHFRSKATMEVDNKIPLQQEALKSYLTRINNRRKSNSIFQKITPALFKPLYTKTHFSDKDKNKMKKIKKILDNFNKYGKQELIQVQANLRTLKDLVRGVYFYNQGWLTNQIPNKRIVFLTEGYIERNTKIVTIQKVWRGYICRKKSKQLQDYCKKFRAVVKIQRWIRRIPQTNRRKFMFYHSWFIQGIHQKYFYVKPFDYFEAIQKEKETRNQIKKSFSFPQQNIRPYLESGSKELFLFWDERVNSQTVQFNYKNRKCIFYSQYIENLMKCSKQSVQLSLAQFQELDYTNFQLSHLFHYKTKSTIINHRGIQYFRVECSSKVQCRKRVLGICLLTYNFRNTKPIILTDQSISLNQVTFKRKIQNQFQCFVKSQKFAFQQFAGNQFNISVKFYLQKNQQSKPTKMQQNLQILIKDKNSSKKEQNIINRNESKSQIIRRKFKKRSDINLKNYLLTQITDHGQSIQILAEVNRLKTENSQKHIEQNLNLKCFVKKRRSVKHIKMLKQVKHNFMLDSVSGVQRFATQPDLQLQNTKIQTQKHKSTINNQLKQKVIKMQQDVINKKKTKEDSKDTDNFTTNFVNIANFIQNQYAVGYRRKIKSQISQQNYASVQRIKSMEKKSKQKIIKLQQHKQIQARKKHQQHKDIILKSSLQNISQKQMTIKKHHSIGRKMNSQLNPKRMKVTFAQQCYPIMNNKHSQSFDGKG